MVEQSCEPVPSVLRDFLREVEIHVENVRTESFWLPAAANDGETHHGQVYFYYIEYRVALEGVGCRNWLSICSCW